MLRFRDSSLARAAVDRRVSGLHQVPVGLLGLLELLGDLGSLLLAGFQPKSQVGRTTALLRLEEAGNALGEHRLLLLEVSTAGAQPLAETRVTGQVAVVVDDLHAELLALVVEHGLRMGGLELRDRVPGDRCKEASDAKGHHYAASSPYSRSMRSVFASVMRVRIFSFSCWSRRVFARVKQLETVK